ncbi:MAG: hypothetical protein HN341_02170 [Verrucomicrobia bacterium]|jgi:antitoxin (DNA-binding transcriptional repressor) of toxin-antitoxin stability system|nr:hypothetical protein [Verrucomicrobiota bacterium]
MDTIISVQDIRTRLGAIAKSAETGESFTVIRNSKPAFRIVPIEAPVYPAPASTLVTLREVRERFDADPVASDELTPQELEAIISEVHGEKNRG